MWHYRQYGVKALAAMGRKAEAIRYAEGGQGLNVNPVAIARACEEVLLSSGLADEAYDRYGLLLHSSTPTWPHVGDHAAPKRHTHGTSRSPKRKRPRLRGRIRWSRGESNPLGPL